MATKDRLKMSKKELQNLQKLQQYVAPVDSSTFIGNYRAKNRYKEKVGDKWVWYDRATGKPWDDKEVLKAFNIDKYGTATPKKDLKFLKSKQLLINKTNIEKPGMQGGAGYNIRRAFSAPTKDPNVKVFDEEMAAKREALGRKLLTAQGQSSYATPLQQQFFNTQSGIATDFLDGLSAKVDFSNTNKLNIAPGFRPEVTDNPAVQKLVGEYPIINKTGEYTGLKGTDDLTIQKANVNDNAPIEKAVNNTDVSQDYEREVARDLNPNEVRTWSTDGGKETVYKNFKEFDEKDASGGKAKWLADTANSPAAKAFGDSKEANDMRWAARQNHLRWLKDKKNKKKLGIASLMDVE